MICPSRVALHSMAHSFTEVHKPTHHDKAVTHEGLNFVDPVPKTYPDTKLYCWDDHCHYGYYTSLVAKSTYNM